MEFAELKLRKYLRERGITSDLITYASTFAPQAEDEPHYFLVDGQTWSVSQNGIITPPDNLPQEEKKPQ